MEDNNDEFTINFLRSSRQRRLERNPDSELRNEVNKERVIEKQELVEDGPTEHKREDKITPVKLKGLAALKARSGTKIERKALVELPCTHESKAENSGKSFGLRALRAMPVIYDNEVSLEKPIEPNNYLRPGRKAENESPKKYLLTSPKVGSETKSRIFGRSDSTEMKNVQMSAQSVCMDPIVKSLEAQGYTKTESRAKIVYDFGASPMKKSHVSLKTDTINSPGSPGNNKPKVLHYFGETPSEDPFQQETNAPSPMSTATPKRAEPSPAKSVIPKNVSPLKGNDSNADIRRIPQVAAERARKIQEMEAARVAKMKSGSTPNANPELRSVSEKAIMFESAATPRPRLKDPAEMTLSERRNFFESQMQKRDSPKINSPSLPSPKATLVTPAKKPVSRQMPDSLSTAKCIALAKEEPPNSAGLQRFQKIAERLKETETENKNIVGSTIKDKINAIYGNQQKESSPSLRPPIVVSASPKKASVPPPPPLPVDDECIESEEEVSENLDSENYSDVEQDNNLDQSMALNSSFAFDILTKTGIQVENKRKSDGSSDQSAKIVRTEEPVHHQPLSPIFSGNMETDTDCGEPDTVEIPKTMLQPSTALDYSLSLYRKQQTPIRKVVRAPEAAATRKGDRETVSLSAAKHQIEALKFEVEKQENVMGQAALALTVCRATEEFSGSSEQVEGEKLLLVAGLKRTAALTEIERLKTACALEKPVGNSCGTLSLSYISLGIKEAFIQHLNDGFDQYVHHFIVVLRCRGQAIATQMISTTDEGVKENGCLAFPNLIQFTELTPEFNVALEVYALQSNKEKFSHDVKYHRKKEKSSLWLTPKKLQKTESKRASMKKENKKTWKSSFGLVGYVVVNRNSLKRKEWSLENVPAQSPLDGSLKVNIQCHGRVTVEERGFLTVFDEVQGFGAWHRRWCVLSGKKMAFWKYPDDEKRKEPISIIDLRDCITPEASAVPRELCARPNTFMLVLSRPYQSGDSNSLVMTIRKNRTLTSHKLSADSKEERSLWCQKVNSALKEMRAWDMDALEPSDNCEF